MLGIVEVNGIRSKRFVLNVVPDIAHYETDVISTAKPVFAAPFPEAIVSILPFRQVCVLRPCRKIRSILGRGVREHILVYRAVHDKCIRPHELVVVDSQSVILIEAVYKDFVIGCRIKKMSVEIHIEILYLIKVRHIYELCLYGLICYSKR